MKLIQLQHPFQKPFHCVSIKIPIRAPSQLIYLGNSEALVYYSTLPGLNNPVGKVYSLDGFWPYVRFTDNENGLRQVILTDSATLIGYLSPVDPNNTSNYNFTLAKISSTTPNEWTIFQNIVNNSSDVWNFAYDSTNGRVFSIWRSRDIATSIGISSIPNSSFQRINLNGTDPYGFLFSTICAIYYSKQQEKLYGAGISQNPSGPTGYWLTIDPSSGQITPLEPIPVEYLYNSDNIATLYFQENPQDSSQILFFSPENDYYNKLGILGSIVVQTGKLQVIASNITMSDCYSDIICVMYGFAVVA